MAKKKATPKAPAKPAQKPSAGEASRKRPAKPSAKTASAQPEEVARPRRKAAVATRARPAHAIGRALTGMVDVDGSLVDLLLRAAEKPGLGMVFVQPDGSEVAYSYADILAKATRRLAGLRAAGIPAGVPVPMVVNHGPEFIFTFWACLLGGIVPAPLTYPTSFTSPNNALTKVREVWQQLGGQPILGDRTLAEKLAVNTLIDTDGMRVLVGESLEDAAADGIGLTPGRADEYAFIQYSSGSTGSPKGVILTHRNLLANVEAIALALGHRTGETVLSWMPFSHDMGLIALHLFPLAGLAKQVNMPPALFVRRPLLWLEKASQHQAVITGSPNFGYRLALDKLTPEFIARLDLSQLRVVLNGAEPIVVPLMREFVATLAPAGLRPEAVYPVYGMAEASVGLTVPPLGVPPLVRAVDRGELAAQGRVKLVDESAPEAMLIPDEGVPIAGSEVRIVDDAGQLLPEGRVGHIQIRGLNVTQGYYANAEATAEVIDGDWLRTGDMGFMIDERVSVTGRAKDIIILDGQKYFAYDLEACAESVEGVTAGKVIACGWHDHAAGRERVALFVGARGDEARALLGEVWKRVNAVFGIAADYMVAISQVPRTTSGKLQRYAMRRDFLAGQFADDTYTPDTLFDAPEAPATPEQPQPILDEHSLREKVTQVWARILGRAVGRIGRDQPFLELGGTSVKAVQVLGALEDELATTLSHDFLLQCRTVDEMVTYLRAHLARDDHAGLVPTLVPERSGTAQSEDIAIIGMACRFPQADTPEAFWDNLVHGRSAIGEVPRDRWDPDFYYQAGVPAPGKTNSRWGGFIEAPYAFDADFFHIGKEEARIMDPQQRLFLQTSWEALERAGHAGARSHGQRVGVFVGASHLNYLEHHLHGIDLQRLQAFDSVQSLPAAQRQALTDEWRARFGDSELQPNTLVDNLLNMIAARTSHALNLKGPALAVDTACSSSLVAVHLACDSLRRGECEVAIAGGVNLNLTPTPYLLFARAGALSPTGRCQVFDANADGMVPGEGAGAVVLKPLSQALADGDPVLAVIKGSTINNDGRSLGVMAPNPDGQRVAIAGAYRDGRLKPADVQYVEAHGTGTAIGDPSELRALAHVFAELGAPEDCVVGSVKANVGHLLSAAGVASLIKLVLALQHRQMPPSLNVTTLNPQIDFAGGVFRVLQEPRDWQAPSTGLARRGAINSFGFGGTNCHLVLEEAPEPVAIERHTRPLHLLCLSAHNEQALQQRAVALAQALQKDPTLDAVDVAHTELSGRAHLPHRLFALGDTAESLADALLAGGDLKRGRAAPVPGRIALMFTGQGAQYPGMARRLYDTLPTFRRILDECAAQFDAHLERPLLECLYAADSDEALLAQTQLTQPLMFAVDYALGRLLLDWGVRPACMLGHSVGEYAAACLAGVMSLADAAKIIAARGRLIAALPAGGGMMAVFDSQENLAPALSGHADRLWFAAHNGAHQVVSGDLAALKELQEQLQRDGKVCRPLRVSHAFHTPLLAPMLDEFARVLAEVRFASPAIPLVSNLGGRWVQDEVLDAAYWREHVLAPVCFEQSVRVAMAQGVGVFVECGPDKVLANLTRSIAADGAVQVLPVLDRKRDDWESLLSTIGSLWLQGTGIDWNAFDADFAPRRIVLPTYPFARDEYRIETRDFGGARGQGGARLLVPVQTGAPVTPMTDPASPAAASTSAGPVSGAVPHDWRELVQSLVAELAQLPATQIDMFRNFNDLGLDSASAVKVAERLSEATGSKLPSTLLFEYQSPAALVEYLQRQVVWHQPPATVAATSAPTGSVATASAAPIAMRSAAPVAVQGERGSVSLRDHDIAIIGMACRLPGADSVDAFWQNLVEGQCQIREIDEGKWSLDDYFRASGEQQSHTTYSKWGAFVERPYDFDPMFFGISPREAEVMDPQQRLFLQVAFEALQQSGYGGDFRTRDIGIFVGCEQNQYGEQFVSNQRYHAALRRFRDLPWYQDLPDAQRTQLLMALRDALQPAELISDAVAGQGLNEIAARVAHWLDLRGPNFVVNTACSSALVALHLACESLRNGESRIAIAGAAYLTGNDSPFVFLSRLGALSPTGHCAPFDEKADGMVLGEAVSAVILKPLKDAVRDGDSIHAVIKGSAVNNDGHSNGITAPNPRGQAEALRRAYVNAGMTPDAVSYIECHGTGTPLGDPVELDGMTQAFRKFTDRKQFCAIGSVKASIGHSLSGSGLPSLIKTVMALKHRTIPPTVRFNKANPHIDFANSPFYMVAGRPQAWQAQGNQPLRAGLNSFGFGGTNCHVVLEEAPALPEPPAQAQRTQLLLLSGRTQGVIQQVASRLAQHVRAQPGITPAQVCLSANGSQRDLAFKAALRVGSREDLLAKLQALAEGRDVAGVVLRRSNPKQTPQMLLVLDGVCPLGPQDVDALIEAFPQLQALCDEAKQHYGAAAINGHTLNQQHLDELLYAFVVQYALGRMLMDAEIRPTAIIAEGTGVLAGACLLGLLDLRQATQMLGRYAQGRLDLPELAGTRALPGEGWHCPLIMPGATLMGGADAIAARLTGYLQQPRRLGAQDLGEMLKPDQVLVHLGGAQDLPAVLDLPSNTAWLDLRDGLDAPSRLLGLFGRLYVHGVRFNALPLASVGVRRVPLPTYPFENRAYRAKWLDVEGDTRETPAHVAPVAPAPAPTPAAAVLQPMPAATPRLSQLMPGAHSTLPAEQRAQLSLALRRELGLAES